MTFSNIKNWLSKNKYLLAIVLLYLLLRLINLTLLPIFNDESIYLDWGWRETTTPGFLFYSLYDAKQPLLMWIFALAGSMFADPLFGGRLVSVGCGFLSLMGIYFLGKFLWNKQTGLFASLLYTISPLFVFYDRQALMESAVATVGIWACLSLVKLTTHLRIRNGILLGLTLGIGYFIKSSVLIFILTSVLIFTLILIQEKQKMKVIAVAFITYIILCLTAVPLLLQPIFWQSLPSNARYSLTLADYLQFPLSTWWQNILTFLGTNFFFLTPFVFFTSCIGIGKVMKKPERPILLVVLWTLLTLSLQIAITRNSSVRYLVSFLPLLLLFASYFVVQLPSKFKIPGILVVSIIPLLMSFWQIITPANYILSLSTFTSLAPVDYVTGETSGYGIPEILHFIDSHATSPTTVAVAENTGNPESAMEMYYENSDHIKTLYLDKRLLGNVVDTYDCIDPGSPLYFISRDQQLAGLDKFFVKIKTITNPYGKHTWGIYTLNPNCKGNIAHLNIEK